MAGEAAWAVPIGALMRVAGRIGYCTRLGPSLLRNFCLLGLHGGQAMVVPSALRC